jgi:predicted GTPase
MKSTQSTFKSSNELSQLNDPTLESISLFDHSSTHSQYQSSIPNNISNVVNALTLDFDQQKITPQMISPLNSKMDKNNINNANSEEAIQMKLNQINLNDYAIWQQQILVLLRQLSDWLNKQNRLQKHYQILIDQVAQYVQNQKINIAFIAEFSRGKSELINALFFANYQTRILPSSSGRTTMCPTELMCDEKKAPYLKLLPIQTYQHSSGTAEFIEHDELWKTIPISMCADELAEALDHLKQTIFVTQEEAQAYGLFDPNNPEHECYVNREGLVEVSKWRHAMINMPHPLLRQGVVILDTPGLNAIGSEPELALRLIPEADMIVFLLAADTGVSKTDLNLWLEHIKSHQHKNAIVVLNKIDTLMDPLKSPYHYEQEIEKQMLETAKHLNILPEQIYPVSAKQGLIAKITQNEELCKQSGLAFLEKTFNQQLIPKRKSLLLDKIESRFNKLMYYIRQELSQEKNNLLQQVDELKKLSKKDPQGIVYHQKRLAIEQEDFEIAILHLTTMRQSLQDHAHRLIEYTQATELEKLRQILQAMLPQAKQPDARLSLTDLNHQSIQHFQEFELAGKTIKMGDLQNIKTPAQAIEKLSEIARVIFDQAIHQEQGVIELLENMIEHLNHELAIEISKPEGFNFLAYEQSFAEMSKNYQRQTRQFEFIKQPQVQQRFFETMSSRLKQWLYNLHQDLDLWLKKTLNGFDAQIKQYEINLNKRSEHASLLMVSNASNSVTVTQPFYSNDLTSYSADKSKINEAFQQKNIAYQLELLQNDLNMLELRLIELQNYQTEFGFLADECREETPTIDLKNYQKQPEKA